MRPSICRPGVVAAVALLIQVLIVMLACEATTSGGSSTSGSSSVPDSTTVSSSTEASRFPARLSALMGRYCRVGQQRLWRLTPDGYAHGERAADYVAGAGRVGSLLAYFSKGEVFLWQPDKASAQDVSAIAVPRAEASSADVIALSLDE